MSYNELQLISKLLCDAESFEAQHYIHPRLAIAKHASNHQKITPVHKADLKLQKSHKKSAGASRIAGESRTFLEHISSMHSLPSAYQNRFKNHRYNHQQ